ncbi:bifunctional riboflavin kinase/FAD synthetase [Oricola cellulosilytica]|uniref:Riboflavin biosynthesis protein n=1 Tax=Oricola cellulosilytica TaxID=1429082 RepID=A0A4R0PFM2_9HYPH|nr:bifunctional riboflavin kinase/FAD synthetase [Oricola cellulosilytica]TCD16636.1 bifunctional riboflavin kinase/FAD synthetase [Oricola cellulosilytica]
MPPRFDSPDTLPDTLRGGVVAIGNFDGVHRGHQAVLNAALRFADREKRPALVLTFEPHPRQVFRPDIPLFRITPATMKAGILGALGFDAVIEMGFTLDFAKLTADEFVGSVIVGGLAASRVVTGFDFHFGRHRQGGPAYLMEAGKNSGFEVTLVDAFRDADAEVVSSTRIREELLDGDIAGANQLLGYRYRITAEVIRGKQLGRTLGYPTANMALPENAALRHGIYAVRFHRADGSVHDGVASFGRRPTVDEDGVALLETHLFDCSDDLYGETCTVSFCEFLRGEEKFQNLDALTAQMKRDEAASRAILSALRPISELDRKLTFPDRAG